eukprot:COSAG01_NODE_6509_length_3627_cov_3.366393_2_plen_109_part_00
MSGGVGGCRAVGLPAIMSDSSSAGFALQIVLKLGEVLAPTASLAFGVQFCGVLVGPLHAAGHSLATREMGGEEAGVYSAVTNCINRSDGVISPVRNTAAVADTIRCRT